MRGTNVRVQIECLAQRDVDRAKAFADRRLERTFERELRPLDRIERRVGNRIAVERDAGHAGDLRVPFDVGARRLENPDGRAADRRPDAVSRDQRDLPGHGAMMALSLEAMLAVI